MKTNTEKLIHINRCRERFYNGISNVRMTGDEHATVTTAFEDMFFTIENYVKELEEKTPI